jgi:hypothetical protein
MTIAIELRYKQVLGLSAQRRVTYTSSRKNGIGNYEETASIFEHD